MNMPHSSLLARPVDDVLLALETLRERFIKEAFARYDLHGVDAALTNYLDTLWHVAQTQELCKRVVLMTVFGLLERGVTDLRMTRETLGFAECSLLAEFPGLLASYLDRPRMSGVTESLVRYFADTRWPVPLSQGEAVSLAEILVAAQHSSTRSASRLVA